MLAALAISIAIITAIFLVGATGLLVSTRRVRRRRQPRPLDPREAKRRAKLENERTKLTATFLNAIGIAILFATAVSPIFKAFSRQPEPILWGQVVAGVAASFCFHLFGLWALRFWRSED